MYGFAVAKNNNVGGTKFQTIDAAVFLCPLAELLEQAGAGDLMQVPQNGDCGRAGRHAWIAASDAKDTVDGEGEENAAAD